MGPKLAIVGAGGLGGYVGAKLARAGADVTFLARGEHLAALRERGLSVKSAHGDFSTAVRATDDAASIGPVDVVLFTVKTYDNESAARAAAPLVRQATAILSLQNGVDNAERIREVVGRGEPLGGVAYIESAVEAPGVIHQPSEVQRVLVGELDGRPTPRVERIVAVLREAGLDAEASTNIRTELWTKWAFICAFSGLTTLCREPIGPIRDTADTWDLYVRTIREVEAVGRAQRVGLAADLVDTLVARTRSFAATGKSSMLRDAERGRPLEIEALNGRVARFGADLGVPTPANAFVHAALLPGHRRALAART